MFYDNMRTPKVQLPYLYIKGSEFYRRMKSRAISEKIFHEILTLYKNRDDVPVSEIGRFYNKLMPATIDFVLKKLPFSEEGSCGGEISTLHEDCGDIHSFRISIPAEKNEFAIENLPLLIHETTHLFDYLCSPKMVKTASKIYSKNIEDGINDFYAKYFYCGNSDNLTKVGLPKLKRITKRFLKNYSKNDRVLVLNYLKESLETELSAFKVQNNCDDYLEKIGRGDRPYTFDDMDRTYHFEDKINMLRKMIFDIILKERYKISMAKAQNPMDKLKITAAYCFKIII